MTVTNNVFVGGYQTLDVFGEYGPVIFTGNTLYNRPSAVHMLSIEPPPGQNLSAYSWDNNNYYGLDSFYFNANFNFGGWQSATGLDAHSTFNPNTPSGAWIYIQPNQYETKRANITIYNWDLNA